MAKKMLIDAGHPEETRVVILGGNRVEEFDFEAAAKKQLKGNIYLAKVTRVEPSLQAAFVEYGGNRHGFLAFSEIHPDYYQIPVADRQALLEEEAAAEREAIRQEEEEFEDVDPARDPGNQDPTDADDSTSPDDEAESETPAVADDIAATNDDPAIDAIDGDDTNEAIEQTVSESVEIPITDGEPDLGARADETVDQGDAKVLSDDDDPGEDDDPDGDDDRDGSIGLEAVSLTPAEISTSLDEVDPDNADDDRTLDDADPQDDATDEAPQQSTAGDADDEAELAPVAAGENSEDPLASQNVQPTIENGDETPSEIKAETDTTSDNDAAPLEAKEPAEDGTEADAEAEPARPDEVGAQDAMEEVTRKKRRMMRRYKIQEVIKRRQIILVQVVKEERGNKGAALTTYLSMAGRYCVLMPNTDRGGGISRKITQANDRKRLKTIANELEVPVGMGLIIRTAGANRTRAELKRDYEYLLRLWESVRELTLRSVAPQLVYEEGNLVKRSIRDLYGRDIDAVLVEGDEAYKEAKSFMRMLTPSHAKNVQPYKDRIPLFQRYQIENQLDALYSPSVELKSGGYIVINPTEALVAIDVNSGRATKEHSIEETALRTNLEAAEEISRQLRLRDLAGLIVVDFIDMEENRNNRQVERRMKDCLKSDRARIQVGRISAFGLLEMSRQRLRSSVLENSTLVCPHCEGDGRVPSVGTATLRVLRAIEEEGIRGRLDGVKVFATTEVALYLLNHKRDVLHEIETRFNMPCFVEADISLISGQFRIEKADDELIAQRTMLGQPAEPTGDLITAEMDLDDLPDIEDETDELAADAAASELDGSDETGEDGTNKRRRRRRRRGGRKEREQRTDTEAAEASTDDEGAGANQASEEDGDPKDGSETSNGRRKRRRGRRGGRRNRRGSGRDEAATAETGAEETQSGAGAASVDGSGNKEIGTIEISTDTESAPAAPHVATDRDDDRTSAERETPITTPAEPPAAYGSAEVEPSPPDLETADQPKVETPNEPPKRGWWQKRFFG